MLSEREIKAIFAHPFFEGLNRQSALSILEAHGCAAIRFAEGEIIHSPASNEKKLGLILEGAATVSTKDPGKNTLLRFLTRGDLFGVANLFTDEPFVSVIRSDKKCTVFFITEPAVRALLETDRTFLYRYLSFLSGRVCFLNRKIGYLTAGSTERRLSLYLSSFEKDEIDLPVSLSALSELLDVGRASLYRSFDRLEADGHIQKEGRHIRILDRYGLCSAYQ